VHCTVFWGLKKPTVCTHCWNINVFRSRWHAVDRIEHDSRTCERRNQRRSTASWPHPRPHYDAKQLMSAFAESRSSGLFGRKTDRLSDRWWWLCTDRQLATRRLGRRRYGRDADAWANHGTKYRPTKCAIAGPLTRSLDTMNQTVRLMAVVEHIFNDHFSDPGREIGRVCVCVSQSIYPYPDDTFWTG